jgi:hypothetical protein
MLRLSNRRGARARRAPNRISGPPGEDDVGDDVEVDGAAVLVDHRGSGSTQRGAPGGEGDRRDAGARPDLSTGPGPAAASTSSTSWSG